MHLKFSGFPVDIVRYTSLLTYLLTYGEDKQLCTKLSTYIST